MTETTKNFPFGPGFCAWLILSLQFHRFPASNLFFFITRVKPYLAILAVACLLQILQDCVILLSFHVNRAFIARELCEQRTIPGNQCQGCCQLRKQLAADESRQSTPAPPLPKEPGQNTWLAVVLFQFEDLSGASGHVQFTGIHALHSGFPHSVDHPPNSFRSLNCRIHRNELKGLS
jgi:hypothetical protein